MPSLLPLLKNFVHRKIKKPPLTCLQKFGKNIGLRRLRLSPQRTVFPGKLSIRRAEGSSDDYYGGKADSPRSTFQST